MMSNDVCMHAYDVNVYMSIPKVEWSTQMCQCELK
jgi:hypothetical protein